MDLFINALVSFAASFLAVVLALWVEHKRQPDIDIVADDHANADVTYAKGHPRGGERWKYFRVRISNKQFGFPFGWIPRYTAQNCSALITFSRVGTDNTGFSMKGRWAGTPEPVHFPGDQVFVKILFPDPVSIAPGASEILDIFTQQESDRCAYGWNNESYLHGWRNPAYKLERGTYNVIVTIITQNGVNTFTTFKCTVGDRIEGTSLVEGLA